MHKLVEYFVTNDSVLAFVVGKKLPANLAPYRVEFPYGDLAGLVRRFREAVKARGDLRDTASQLYSLLIEPLFQKGWLDPGEKLWLAPHRCLRYIPFQALGHGDRQLLDSNAVAYAPVGSVLGSFLSSDGSRVGSVIVKRSGVSDSFLLRESFQREARRVTQLTGGVLLADKAAHREEIEKAVAGKSILHFTCHGTFLAGAPQRSGLVLADREGRDALFNVEMISSMRLNVDLVVIAACDTGVSDSHPGDELVGLIRAFMKAGARSVLATLWPVHTLSTELLIEDFYKHILGHDDFCDSVHRAQLALRSSKRTQLTDSVRAELERGVGAVSEAEANLLRFRWENLRFDARFSSESQFRRTNQCVQAPNPALPKGGTSEHPYKHPYFWSPFILQGTTS